MPGLYQGGSAMKTISLMLAVTLLGAAALNAVPIRMEYTVSGTGPYTYQFWLILDNNDNSWQSGQGWGWLIFGDIANNQASPLTNYSHTSGWPVGPWTSLTTSGGGHNGPTFYPVSNTWWIPTQMNETLTWTGSSSANLGQGQMLWSTLQRTGNGTVLANFEVARLITVEVLATAGARETVTPNDQGPGNDGVVAGTFTIENKGQAGAEIHSIKIAASGSGNDAADLSEVALYWDDNDNGTFDPGTDTLVASHSAFPANNGSLTFDVPVADQPFPINTTRRYLIVAKMSGSGIPASTYDFQVTDITANQGLGVTGLPSGIIQGLIIESATLAVDATAGAPYLVFANDFGPGGQGFHVGTFTITSDNFAGGILEAIQLSGRGTGHDEFDYAEVALYVESNNTAGFQLGSSGDERIATFTSYPSDEGSLVFPIPAAQQVFGANESRTYYVHVRPSGTALGLATLDHQVTDLQIRECLKDGLPSAIMAGLQIRAPEFVVNDNTPATSRIQVPLGAQGVLMQAFSITYPEGPDNQITGAQVRGGGTGHEVSHISSVQLWRDVNGDQQLDAGDVLISTGSYALDNGQVNLDMPGQAVFQAPETRHYLLVYNFNMNAPDGATFYTYVHGFLGSAVNTVHLGTPSPSLAGTPGVEINANVLEFTLNGPSVAMPVDSDSQGPHGDGELLLDFTVTARLSYMWTLSEITIRSMGTADPAQSYSEVSLYEDSGSGVWDGSAVDSLAASTLSGFDSSGLAQFTLVNSSVTQAAARRFFVVGKLAGMASAGQTLNARVEAISATSSSQGLTLGVPSATSTALVIDVAVMTIAQAPGSPATQVIKAGQAAQVALGKFLLSARNETYLISGITFTTTGTGDWTTNLEPTTGFQVFEDDGDGAFNPILDLLVFEGAGATPTVNALFTSTRDVPNAGSLTFWVVLNLLETAGAGAASAPATFAMEIATANHVATTGTRVLGTPPPASNTLGVVDFFVSSFTPLRDTPNGGADITMEGSGFLTPFTVRIGGVLCQGTPIVAAGTRVTGLRVPEGTAGRNIPLEVTSGLLPVQTLTQTFTYAFPSRPGSDGGCAAGSGLRGLVLPLGLLALVAFALRQKRRVEARRALQ
jgi:hypothetical protein